MGKLYISLMFLLFGVVVQTTGVVILLQGTSSAGKSSISQELVKLFDGKFEQISIDDFTWKVVIQKMEQRGLVDQTASLEQAQKLFMHDISDEQRDSIMEEMGTWLLPKQMLHDEIRKRVLNGENIIVDHVLGDCDSEDILDFLIKMKNVPVYIVNVYCSPQVLLQHTIQRNNDKPAEKRNVYFILSQFCQYYKSQQQSEKVIDELDKQDIEKLLADRLLLDENSFTNVTEEDQKKLLQLYFDIFDLHNNQQSAITSKFAFDILVNTGKHSSQQCAQHIKDWIENNVAGIALQKNCERFLV